MKLKFLGTGNAFSKTKGPSCAILREEYDTNKYEMLVDAGEGVAELVIPEVESGNLWKDTDLINILITHTHPDHVAGIGKLLYELRYKFDIKSFRILIGCMQHYGCIFNILHAFGVLDPTHNISVEILVWDSREPITTGMKANEIIESYLDMVDVPHMKTAQAFGFRVITTTSIPKVVNGEEPLIKSKDVIMYSGDTNRFFGYSADSIDSDIYMDGVTSMTMYHEASVHNSPVHMNISELLYAMRVYITHFFKGAPKSFVLYHLPDDITSIDQLRVYGDIDSLDIALAETKYKRYLDDERQKSQ